MTHRTALTQPIESPVVTRRSTAPERKARRAAGRRRMVPLLLCASLGALGCADMEAGERTAPAEEPAPTQAAANTRAKNDTMLAGHKGHPVDGEGQESVDQDAVRKLIQTAELHVQVESYGAARANIDKRLAELGGFVANAQVEHSDGNVSHATLSLRIPADKLDVFLASTAAAGDVTHEVITAQDITESYYDVAARLKNAKRLESRLLTLLDSNADTVTSLLEVERELARVRGEIERFEGKIRLWDKQVSLATVNLRLVTKRVYQVSATPPPTLMDRIGRTLGGSFVALKSLGTGLLLFAVALVPWLIPLLLLGWALRSLFRRMTRRIRRHPDSHVPNAHVPHAAAVPGPPPSAPSPAG